MTHAKSQQYSTLSPFACIIVSTCILTLVCCPDYQVSIDASAFSFTGTHTAFPSLCVYVCVSGLLLFGPGIGSVVARIREPRAGSRAELSRGERGVELSFDETAFEGRVDVD